MTVSTTRTFSATPQELWRVVGDAHHLPRWWPRVRRVEGVERDRWTSVLVTDKGKSVRADYRLVESSAPHRRRWTQELEDTPFERLLSEAVTEVEIEPTDDGARVTLVLQQRLRGWSRLAGWLFRRAGRRQLDDALDGLEALYDRDR